MASQSAGDHDVLFDRCVPAVRGVLEAKRDRIATADGSGASFEITLAELADAVAFDAERVAAAMVELQWLLRREVEIHRVRAADERVRWRID